jgi:uncharacterized protein (TIGR03382 family)
MTLFLALAALCSVARADSEYVGGTDQYGYQNGMMKLVEFEATETAVLTGLAFGYSHYSYGDELELVAYHWNNGQYELLGSVASTPEDSDSVMWATTGPVSWILQAGETYALGAYVGDGVFYFYQDDQTDDPWWGAATGTYQVEENVPDSFEPTERESHFYYLRLDASPADADGDGGVDEAYGGDDCDDTDATVGAGAAETAYDGVDQDCDGFDLTDADLDGEDAVEAGGTDCDDASASVGTAIEEICDDGIDQDCSGADLGCDEAGAIPEVDASADCGCDAGATGGIGALALGFAALVGRRRPR